jgi:ADP-heptose:LPS heptosyltransferase
MNRTTLRRALRSTLARLPWPTRQPGAPRRILVIRPDHLGDLLFLTPALHTLRMANPGVHLACLVGPWGEAILRDNPDLDELLTCDFPWFNRRAKASPWQPYAVLWREALRLRRMHFDTAYVMRFDFWWGAALARLAGIPRRIGYALPGVQPFLTDAITYTPGLHEVEQNLCLVGALPSPQVGRGVGGEGAPPLRFTIPSADLAWADTRLNRVSLTSDSGPRTPNPHLIALHVGAGAPVKLWETERWAQTLNTLVERHGAKVVLTGGASEVALARAIADSLEAPPVVLAGETTLGQLAAVLARCRLVLGADSGPLHLAVAVGAPTVHLFGPIDPALFGPWGDPAQHVVVQARFFDEPCHNRPCNRLDYAGDELAQHTCMRTITVEDVVTAASRLLA